MKHWRICNSGIPIAALAIRDTDKNLSDYLINRSVQSIKNSLIEYSPDGNYPEGYSYWSYGTTYAGLMFAALHSVFNHTFGLAEWPGFAKSGKYIQYMVGTSNLNFNYYDSGPKGVLQPILYWFAYYYNDPSLVFYNNYILEVLKTGIAHYYLPIVLVFGSRFRKEEAIAPSNKMYYGKGITPVILVRTSWELGKGLSFGFKGGKPWSPHAHMGQGTFVFDSDGVRWASDLGTLDYIDLSNKGIDYWDYSQEGQRWVVYKSTVTPLSLIHI